MSQHDTDAIADAVATKLAARPCHIGLTAADAVALREFVDWWRSVKRHATFAAVGTLVAGAVGLLLLGIRESLRRP